MVVDIWLSVNGMISDETAAAYMNIQHFLLSIDRSGRFSLAKLGPKLISALRTAGVGSRIASVASSDARMFHSLRYKRQKLRVA